MDRVGWVRMSLEDAKRGVAGPTSWSDLGIGEVEPFLKWSYHR